MLPGAVLRVLSPQGELTPFGVRAGDSQFRVAAIFESGFYDLDNQFAFVSLEEAQRLFSTGDVVNALELRLADVYDAPAVARAAETLLNAGRRDKLGATHWMEQNRQLLSALRLERTVSTITISLIQLVAALNIFTALVMSVMEKRRDIAVLIALGAKPAQIARIFIAQGLLIGLCGVLLGLVSGYGLSFLADHYRWIALDEEIYSISYVPFQPHFADALWISAAALVVSFLATLYPARAATRLMPCLLYTSASARVSKPTCSAQRRTSRFSKRSPPPASPTGVRCAPNCASCPASLRLNRRCTARSSPPGRSNRPRPRSRACPSTPPS